MKLLFVIVCTSNLFALNNESLPFEVINKHLTQGGFLIGKVTQGTKVSFLNKNVPFTKEGIFVIGFGRDFSSIAEINVNGKVYRLPIRKRQWKTERVDGVPPSKVNPKSKKVLQGIAEESKSIREARATNSGHSFFLQDWQLPAIGRISGVYGSQRILNGVPKRPHYGLDIAAATGTPVITPVKGIVSLINSDMFYSGGTIIIDHGLGLSSTFIHLSKVSVKVGQVVEQGDTIGLIGATGRASGPHLDWRINWFEHRLDPALFVSDKLKN